MRAASRAAQVSVRPTSQPRCCPGGRPNNCTRARLSAEGKLHTCLFASHGHDLRSILRGGATDQELAQRLRTIWTARADRYSEARTAQTAPEQKIEMSYIGG